MTESQLSNLVTEIAVKYAFEENNPSPQPKIIRGDPCDKWDEVQAAQHEPFIWIISNGAKWYGDELSADFTALIDCLSNHRLEYEIFSNRFIRKNPCHWAYGDPSKGEPRYVDGKRMFEAEITSFFGNFEDVSHAFTIYTNHEPTIDMLTDAIAENRHRFNVPE